MQHPEPLKIDPLLIISITFLFDCNTSFLSVRLSAPLCLCLPDVCLDFNVQVAIFFYRTKPLTNVTCMSAQLLTCLPDTFKPKSKLGLLNLDSMETFFIPIHSESFVNRFKHVYLSDVIYWISC